MKNTNASLILLSLFLGGCAHIDFNSGDSKGLTYFEPVPHLLVARAKAPDGKCTTTVSVIMIPGATKSMTFHQGWGSSDLSVTLTNGMVTQVGQKSDLKIPETINAVANVMGAIPHLMAACEPPAELFRVEGQKIVPADWSIKSSR